MAVIALFSVDHVAAAEALDCGESESVAETLDSGESESAVKAESLEERNAEETAVEYIPAKEDRSAGCYEAVECNLW